MLIKDGTSEFQEDLTPQLLIISYPTKYIFKYRYTNLIKITLKSLPETGCLKSPLPSYPPLFYTLMFLFTLLDFPNIVF